VSSGVFLFGSRKNHKVKRVNKYPIIEIAIDINDKRIEITKKMVANFHPSG
jgi:hypothetical protein